MRALVVYESMYGNTRDVAMAIAAGLEASLEVSALPVEDAPTTLPDDIGLLVVGGPTHAFGMSRPNTRQQAAEAGPLVTSARTGIREWLDRVEPGAATTPATAFDTKVSKPRLPGSAARAAGKRLRRRGFFVITPAETFHVTATAGPLLDGEAQRAEEWGKSVGALLQPR